MIHNNNDTNDNNTNTTSNNKHDNHSDTPGEGHRTKQTTCN